MPNHVQVDGLSPVQAGLSAALRRAFGTPADDQPCDFDDLLRRLD